jgi:septum site-determining protein MinD
MANAKIIGIVSMKGGVGKTTTTASVGASLAEDFNKRVLLVDANLTVPNLGFQFNEPFPDIPLSEVLAGKVKVRDAIIEWDSKLHLLLTTLSEEHADMLSKLKKMLEPLKDKYDFILLDSTPALSPELINVMQASDELIVVTSLDYPTTGASLKLINMASELSIPVRGVIINKSRGKHFEIDTQNIMDALCSDILGVIPDDAEVLEALYNKYPITIYRPCAKAAIRFREVAALLADQGFSVSIWDKLRNRMFYHKARRRMLRKRFGY